jgi:hypothetical protein
MPGRAQNGFVSLEFLAQDKPGYWEQGGIMNGDPWKEERFRRDKRWLVSSTRVYFVDKKGVVISIGQRTRIPVLAAKGNHREQLVTFS